jgi:hypothetical protein
MSPNQNAKLGVISPKGASVRESATTQKAAILFALFLAIYTVGYLYFYLTGSLFYFGEAISYEGLLRVLHNQPFATSPAEIPVSLTPYTPLFLGPLILLGKLLGLTQIESVSVLARGFHLLLLLGLFLFLDLLRHQYFSDISSKLSYFWVVLPVFFYSPTMELGLRPDTFSFFCEAISLFYLLKFLRYRKSRSLFFSAFFSSLALFFKANTLGGVAGICLFFFWDKNFKSLFLYALCLSLTLAIGFGIEYLVLGNVLTENIFASIQSLILPADAALQIYVKLLRLFILPLLGYFYLVLIGLRAIPQRKERRLISLILLFSFLFAFLGQLKWGAFHNYFLGVLYLGLIPASIAFFKIAGQASPRKRQWLFAGFLGYLVFLIAPGISVPYKIWKDRSYFSELKSLRNLVQEKVPSGYLYTTDEKMSLAFENRLGVGVLSEELLQTTPRLYGYTSLLEKKLLDFNGYIFNCEKFDQKKITGLFFKEDKLRNLKRISTGNYCLFY